jgi:hypothetical protein
MIKRIVLLTAVLPLLASAACAEDPARYARLAPRPKVVAMAIPAQPPAAAPATPPPAPPPAPIKTAEKLALKRLVIARSIKAREPEGVSETFEPSDRLYAFVEVQNVERLRGEVFVTFVSPAGKQHGPVPLAIGEGERWRTWAFTRQAKEPGTWTAIVKDSKGKVLGKRSFEIHSALRAS